MTSTNLWLINTLLNIGCLEQIATCLLIVGLAGASVYYMLEKNDSWHVDDEQLKSISKWIKRGWIALIPMLLIAMAIPTKKEFALIYVIPKITNSQKLGTAAEKALDFANNLLEAEKK